MSNNVLLQKCILCLQRMNEDRETTYILQDLEDAGFTPSEIEEIGFGWVLPNEKEE